MTGTPAPALRLANSLLWNARYATTSLPSAQAEFHLKDATIGHFALPVCIRGML